MEDFYSNANVLTFIVDCDLDHGSVDARFSHPTRKEPTAREEHLMQLVGTAFSEKMTTLLYESFSDKTVAKVKYICSSILRQIEEQYGYRLGLEVVKIENKIVSHPNRTII